MARITRRKILKLSGAGAVAARTGGLAAILAAGRAPALAQAKTVHWLRWADFVPASAGCSRARSRKNAKRLSVSSSRSRLSTPTTSKRALLRRSSPAPTPISS